MHHSGSKSSMARSRSSKKRKTYFRNNVDNSSPIDSKQIHNMQYSIPQDMICTMWVNLQRFGIYSGSHVRGVGLKFSNGDNFKTVIVMRNFVKNSNRNLHTDFQMVSFLLTLDDLEGSKCHLWVFLLWNVGLLYVFLTPSADIFYMLLFSLQQTVIVVINVHGQGHKCRKRDISCNFINFDCIHLEQKTEYALVNYVSVRSVKVEVKVKQQLQT